LWRPSWRKSTGAALLRCSLWTYWMSTSRMSATSFMEDQQGQHREAAELCGPAQDAQQHRVAPACQRTPSQIGKARSAQRRCVRMKPGIKKINLGISPRVFAYAPFAVATFAERLTSSFASGDIVAFTGGFRSRFCGLGARRVNYPGNVISGLPIPAKRQTSTSLRHRRIWSQTIS